MENPMEQEELLKLIDKYKSGTLSEEEKLFLDSWYSQYAAKKESDFKTETLHDNLLLIRNGIESALVSEGITLERKIVKLHQWRKVAAAAAVFLAIVGTAIYFVLPTKDEGLLAMQNIHAGGQSAYLTLANGKNIKLSGYPVNRLSSQGGVQISQTKDGKLIYAATVQHSDAAFVFNTLTVPLGGVYKVQLSDGSTVMLNSGSSLEFPVSFHGGERLVKLKGEGYFEVAKNPAMPFIVEAGKIRTKVLGTHFNISTYADDKVQQATLLEGKIQVHENGTDHTVILEPGQQASLTGNQLQVANVEAADFAAWHEGTFVFNNESLKIVMQQLSRWYNVEVDYATLPDRKLYMRMSREVNLAEVLRRISLTSNIKFSFREGRVAVTN